MPEKQTRVYVACEQCRKRKMRCDSSKPKCGNCVNFELDCEYRLSERQSKVTLRYSTLEKRLGSCEEVLNKILNNISALQQLKRINKSSNSRKPRSKPRRAASSRLVLDGAVDTFNTYNGAETRESLDNLLFYGMKRPSDQNEKTLSKSFPTFNDRLCLLKRHAGGDENSVCVFTSGVFLSILSPEDITNLSRKLNDPHLSTKLERVSSDVWRDNKQIASRLFDPGENAQFLPEFLESCLGAFARLDSNLVTIFLTVDELKEAMEMPDTIKMGATATLVIYATMCMNLIPNLVDLRFSGETFLSQERLAYSQAIRFLNVVRFCRPSFLLLRVTACLSLGLYLFSTVPSVSQYIGLLLDICKAIGIHRPEINAKYPDEELRRNKIWAYLRSLHFSVMIAQSREPLITDFMDTEKLDTPIWDSDNSEIRLLLYCQAIDEIYTEVRQRLFCVKGNITPADTLRDICKFHHSTNAWMDGLPMNPGDYSRLSWKDGVLQKFSDWTRKFTLGNILSKYHHTMIAIHSIPAFYPDYLPSTADLGLPELPDSLMIVSSSARMLLEICVNAQRAKKSCNAVMTSAATSSVGCLFYKQLRFPDHESNDQDLELLKSTLPLFQNPEMTWPALGMENPVASIWTVLIEIMDKLNKQHSQAASLVPDTHSDNASNNSLPITPVLQGDGIMTSSSIDKFDEYISEKDLHIAGDECIIG